MLTALTLSFAITALLIELTPGPNMVWLAILSARRGRRAGLAATAGVALGLTLLALAAIFGLATFLSENPALLRIFGLAGVAFMVWLAWDAWNQPIGEKSVEAPTRRSLFAALRRGFLINVLNLKAALFFLTVLPNFVEPQRAVQAQYLLLATIYVATATVIHFLLVLGGQRLGHIIARHAGGVNVRLISTLALLGVAAWMLTKTF